MSSRERSPRKSTVRRRTAILDAALRCFTRHGLAATTIADIRNASASSTGSLYHHFGSKEDIAAALYVLTLTAYCDGLVAKVIAARRAERGVRAMVAYHLDWVARQPHRARFLQHTEPPAPGTPAGRELAAAKERFVDAFYGWVDAQIGAGAIRKLPRDLIWALALGPTESYTRAWLDGPRRSPLPRDRRALADGAWAAIGKSRTGKSTRSGN